MRRVLLVCGLLVVTVLVLMRSCNDEPVVEETTELAEDDPARRAPTQRPRRYSADWFIDPSTAGRAGGGYFYLEVIDDFSGSYSVQTAKHRAVQTRENVTLCAQPEFGAVAFECASIERASGVPDVASLALGRLREWSPRGVFEIVGEPSMLAAAERNPAAWSTEAESHRGIQVRCWEVVSETSEAPLGFKVCFTNDENALVASIDLTGDLLLEVDMQSYSSDVPEGLFEIDAEVQQDSQLYERLLFMFPEVPLGEIEEATTTGSADGAG